MAGKNINYDIILSATARGIEVAMRRGGDAAARMSKNIASSVREANRHLGSMVSSAGKVGLAFGTAGAAAGVYAFTQGLRTALTEARALQQANFNMVASVEAANRQFQVGSIDDWNKTVQELSKSLRIYSDTDLKAAISRTVDMTKRLGLNEDQMRKVIEVSADLSSGKFELVDGIERVTAALRGEAEASEALGLTLNENYVKGWYEASNATGKAWKDLTDVEKAQVRYNVLLEQAAPLLGKAAASYGEYGGALTATKSAYSDLFAAIGGVITQNKFVVEVLHLAEKAFDDMAARVNANRGEVMQSVKDMALAAIDFGQTMITVAGLAVSAGNGISGVFRTTAAASLYLSGGIFRVIEGMTTLTDKLGLTENAAEEWRINAEAAFEAAGQVFGDAKEDFAQMSEGSAALGTASTNLERMREAIAGIDAGEMEDAADATKKASDELVNIGGVWQQMSSAAMDRAAEEVEYAANAMRGNTEELGVDWGRVWDTMQREALTDIDGVENRLDELTSKRREVTVYVKEVVQKAVGGMVQRFAAGGRLPGYGGGDRIPALLEAGEFIIRKEAVARFGSNLFAALNSLQLPKFAAGGQVASAGPSLSGPALAVDLRLSDGPPVRIMTDRAGYDAFLREAARRQRLASA